jgi:hypothetical protein
MRVDHAKRVDAWMKRVSPDLSPDQLILVFESSFDALWRRAHRILGDVTLSAIVDRVIVDVADDFPVVGALRLERGSGVQFRVLRGQIRPDQTNQLRQGMRATLIQFLTVVGNLTADIPTPALHQELDNVDVEGLTITGERVATPPAHRVAKHGDHQ